MPEPALQFRIVKESVKMQNNLQPYGETKKTKDRCQEVNCESYSKKLLDEFRFF